MFLKGCPLRCQWCANPESNSAYPELLYHPGKCIGCRQCISRCPSGAASTEDGRIRFDRSRCTGCFRCTPGCHAAARKVSGRSMTVEEVFSEVAKDMVFYETSDGGITFSGGEPLLWPSFVQELSALMQERGVHTAIETCGHFPPENFLAVRDVTDLILFDLKFIDEAKHIRYCGTSNRQILANFRSVMAAVPVVVRIPIIPGINDALDDLQAIIGFLLPFRDALKGIQFLPYHPLGAGKFDALGRPYLLQHITAPSKDHMEEIKALFERSGYTIRTGG